MKSYCFKGGQSARAKLGGGVRSEHHRQRADVGVRADRVCMARDNYKPNRRSEACYTWRTRRDSGDCIVISRY